MAIALRAGLPLEDMEFVQFHPTGLAGLGILVTEGARGEGGILRNADGERFMERYAPTIKDLAPRDIVARAMANEVREGRGCGPHKDYVLLDLTHLEPSHIDEKLPDITEFARTYLAVEPHHQPIPVFPTAHYAMGGIPTNNETEVYRNSEETIPGLYAAGEVACVSVHGANRLGTNSLLDINVFGKRAGRKAEYAASAEFVPVPDDAADRVLNMLNGILEGKGTEKVGAIRADLQKAMEADMQVFRTDETIRAALATIAELEERYQNISIQDKGKRFNLDLLEAVELGFLIELAKVMSVGALHRKESRGGHYREDFPKRDDVNFMKHSMVYLDPESEFEGVKGLRFETKPVVYTRYEPKERSTKMAETNSPNRNPSSCLRVWPAATRFHPTYDVVIKIRRYNPEVSSEAYWDEFPLTMYRTDRVLDALHKIKWEVDGSVSFRRSCAHGICGSRRDAHQRP